ncbi:hypothetical protein KPATCC21470_8715 [Kitasatospora purpeofusca]
MVSALLHRRGRGRRRRGSAGRGPRAAGARRAAGRDLGCPVPSSSFLPHVWVLPAVVVVDWLLIAVHRAIRRSR